MHPLMLCIHMSPERAMRLSFTALSLGIKVKVVEPAQEGQTLAALCGLETAAAPADGPQVEEEMLLLAFMPDGLLDRLLPALRSAAPPAVRLKAVLTPSNRDWTCGQLYRELAGEAAALEARRK